LAFYNSAIASGEGGFMWFMLLSLVWLSALVWQVAPRSGLSPVLLALLSGMLLSLLPNNRFVSFQGLSSQWQQRLGLFQQQALRLGLILFCLQLPVGLLTLSSLLSFWPLLLIVPLQFVSGRWLGQRLGVSANSIWLVSAGISFCGSSALFATQSIRRANATELNQSLAAVLLMGLLALGCYALLPLAAPQLARVIGLTAPEVSQVVAASSALPAAAAGLAVVLKLCRVLLLVPFLMVLPLISRQQSDEARQALPLFPWLVLGAAALQQSGVLPQQLLPWYSLSASALLTAAIWLAGVQTCWQAMRQGSRNTLLLALLLLLQLAAMTALWLFLVSAD